MEHLENPLEYLRHFLRILKPNGRLVLILPVSRSNKATRPDYKSGHLYAWTMPCIWELLERVGFKIVVGKFNHASGFSLFYRMPYPLANLFLRILGGIRRQREMIIVAKKLKGIQKQKLFK